MRLGQVPTVADSESESDAGDNKMEGESAEKSNQPSGQLSEIDQALLEEYVKSEKQLIEAFTSAFGADQGRKKAREGILKSLKAAGREDLIPKFKEMADRD